MKHIKDIILIVFILVSLDSCIAQEQLEYPEFFIEKIDLVPDILMTDRALELPDGGGYFCGPVSVANSFIYLNNKGFEKLLPDYQGDSMRIYHDLICQLSEDKYMKTISNKMTPTPYMIRGIKKYTGDCGYEIEKIKSRKFGKEPGLDIDWLKNCISSGHETMVFLWITKEVEPNVMKIIAGHWVSLVGYGKDEKDNVNSNILIIHDPGSGHNYNANDFVELKLCNSDFKAGKQNFKNYYELKNFDCTNGADYIFLSGIISFKLKE